MRRCLAGLDEFVASALGDAAAQDAAIDSAIADADARIRRELMIEMGTVRVASWPDDDMVLGTDYDVEEEPYDFTSAQFRRWGFVRLRRRPVQSVQRVRLMLGRHNTILTYPQQWIRINKRSGHLSIVPTPGAGWSGLVLQGGTYFIPYYSSGWMGDNIPQVIAVDYTAGLGGDYAKDEYADLRHQRARLAAAELLQYLAHAKHPGVQSISISEDGASESVSYTRGGKPMFQDFIDAVEAEWRQFKQSVEGTETGIGFTVL